MINLDTTLKSLEVVLGAAATTTELVFTADYVDKTTTTYVPGDNNGPTNGTTAVVAAAAPAASTQRQVKRLGVYNLDTVLTAVIVQINNNGTKRRLFRCTLLPSESLQYIDGIGFDVIGAMGARKSYGPAITAASVMNLSRHQRIFMSDLPDYGAVVLTSNKAYWVYLGRILSPVVVKYVEFKVTTVGAGAQTGEIALCSSSAAPNKAAQVLTKLTADGTLDSLTVGTTVKRNTSSLAYTVAAGTHLWAGIRTAMATTQPELRGITQDYAAGQVLSTATAGALTGAGPWTGAITTAASTIPSLRVTQD